MPLHYELEDEPYFAFNLSPAVPAASRASRRTARCWATGTGTSPAFTASGCACAAAAPRDHRHAGRIDLLRELLEGLSHDDVWVATGDDVAQWWATRLPVTEGHPVDVSAALPRFHRMTERMQLAQFCAGTRFEDLPPALVARAKRHILDTFGATLAGAGVEPRQARQMFEGEPAASPVWGTIRTSAPRRRVANGVAAHALELDDTGGCDHSGAVVLPAAIAAVTMSNRQ